MTKTIGDEIRQFTQLAKIQLQRASSKEIVSRVFSQKRNNLMLGEVRL